jgi:hypothetical protein
MGLLELPKLDATMALLMILAIGYATYPPSQDSFLIA